ncbi:hypothetical protein [Rhodococcus sp. WS3]|uniref:hypothetical protein n=1 Tax=Rhodococcus sp. WS3 TaxID=2486271 RepID=UPI0011438D88|nr:hypothetical protein [Rhodococcus sp. WS3]
MPQLRDIADAGIRDDTDSVRILTSIGEVASTELFQPIGRFAPSVIMPRVDSRLRPAVNALSSRLTCETFSGSATFGTCTAASGQSSLSAQLP